MINIILLWLRLAYSSTTFSDKSWHWALWFQLKFVIFNSFAFLPRRMITKQRLTLKDRAWTFPAVQIEILKICSHLVFFVFLENFSQKLFHSLSVLRLNRAARDRALEKPRPGKYSCPLFHFTPIKKHITFGVCD